MSDKDIQHNKQGRDVFFCGIGGSGMLPLAVIVKARGGNVAGSDRALDQGRSAPKFEWLRAHGIEVFPQDGSGVTSGDQLFVASAAIEDSVCDVVRASELGCERRTRAALLAELFNASEHGIAVGGTSGKSTVTGMIGWVLAELGRDPTIMNGAVMTNFVDVDAPASTGLSTGFASARVGGGDVFVSEVDESDGSIALFRPEIAVINNISLDHKSMDELRALFGGFAVTAQRSVYNANDGETRKLIESLDLDRPVSFGLTQDADYRAEAIAERPLSISFDLRHPGGFVPVQLAVPGKHNVANALAAIAACAVLGVDMADAARAIGGFTGLARRFELVGTANGVTVIDDFAHNPDKVAASLATLKAFPGRVIAFFQPHGYGPLRQMGDVLAQSFAGGMGPDDLLIVSDPAYYGGTVDRSVGSDAFVAQVVASGAHAKHIAERAACGDHIATIARPGDRIVVMGARDDTLSQFARDILAGVAQSKT